MRISTVYVRFYRAFNFDYLRKHHPGSQPHPWDTYDGLFYPYVKVDLDDAVTCVVGANEAGKSQLLDAIEFALGSKTPDPADFCRYSHFFTVDSTLRLPHFGLQLSGLGPEGRSALAILMDAEVPDTVDDVHVFRETSRTLKLFLPGAIEPVEVNLGKDAVSWLPRSFRIDPARPIPDSVPIEYLAGGAKSTDTVLSRHERWSLLDPIVSGFGAIRSALSANPPNPASLASLLPTADDIHTEDNAGTSTRRAAFELAFKLLVTVGGVDRSTFSRLQDALRAEDEGFANGLVASINRQLSEALNLHRWWSQDVKFELQVDARDFDLVFTIRDRTASEYSFAERSSGLKYFLSYLVQYLAHLAEEQPAGVLLMDEPDAFLSNQGQQDLLRLFQDFADGSNDHAVRQVVFVTHSPFLIDKNRADRVRVLDKGADDEGTRVVRDAGRNHFEPLRSAFGGFIGETTFIGNCNLMLEGVSDQIYVAGLSSTLLRQGVPAAERLDLNEITLVPAGSASHVPYMVYLARGRDADQPAVVVLLDGDREGDDARKALDKGGARGRQVLEPRFVLQIKPELLTGVSSARPEGPLDMEDLVPPVVLAQACLRFGAEVGAEVPEGLTDRIITHLSKSRGVFNAAQEALKALNSDLLLDKIAIARHVVALLEDDGTAEVEIARANFRHLLMRIGELQRLALHERSRIGVGRRVDRVLSSFLEDHQAMANRSDLKIALERVEALLDSTREAEEIRKRIRILRHEHALTADLAQPVTDFPMVRASLIALKYAGVLASQEEEEWPAGEAAVKAATPAKKSVVPVKTRATKKSSSPN